MAGLGAILAAAAPIAGGFAATVPPGWMQGRTTYGGLSAALAFEAARRTAPDLPPLRSAQVAFIGPLAGTVAVTATVLRRGRTAAFVQSDVTSQAGLGLRATFVFMADLPSPARLDTGGRPDLVLPDADAVRRIVRDDFFIGHFELADVPDPAEPATQRRWVRLRDRGGIDPILELLAVGDAQPPAAAMLLEGQKAPVSSIDWMVNVRDPAPATTEGWWLLESVAEHALAGNSSQTMRMWNAAGACVASGMQSVAIFG